MMMKSLENDREALEKKGKKCHGVVGCFGKSGYFGFVRGVGF